MHVRRDQVGGGQGKGAAAAEPRSGAELGRDVHRLPENAVVSLAYLGGTKGFRGSCDDQRQGGQTA